MNITELVTKAEAGDNQAIAELYQLTSKQAYSLAMQITKNEEESFDILQDSYLKAFDNLSSLKDKSKFTSWFYQILANKCRDFLKSKRNTNVLFSDMTYETDNGEQEVEFIDENSTFSPEENTDYNETKRLLAEMIDNLPDEQKLVVLMHYMQDLSIKEIAQSLEVSENTVKSRLNYAKKKIKVQVEDLEKKGTKLYGITGLSLFGFIIWMLKGGAEATAVPAFAEVVATKGVATSAVASTAAKTASKSILTKVIAGAVAVTIASTAIGVGVVVASKNNNDSNNDNDTRESNISMVSEETTEESTDNSKAIPLLDIIVNGDERQDKYYELKSATNGHISFELPHHFEIYYNSAIRVRDNEIYVDYYDDTYGPFQLNVDYGTATQGNLKVGDIITLSIDNVDIGDSGLYFTETEKEIRIEAPNGITREQAQQNVDWFIEQAYKEFPHNAEHEIIKVYKVLFLESNNAESLYGNRVLVAFADSTYTDDGIIISRPVFINDCYLENNEIKYYEILDCDVALVEPDIERITNGDPALIADFCFPKPEPWEDPDIKPEDLAEYYTVTELTVN